MFLRKLFWIGAGAATGGYLVQRMHRNLESSPRPLFDHLGRELEPTLLELDGGECVEVVEAGEGPAVVLVPGLTGDNEVFRYQVAALSPEYRVIAPDLRARFAEVEPQFDQFAHDLARVLDALGVPSAAFLGLSFGGPICMRFTTLYPERVTGLILTNTLARLDLSHVGLNRTLLIPIARWTSRFLPVPLMRKLSALWGSWGVWVYDQSEGNDRIIDYELDAPVRVPLTVSGNRMDTFRDRDLRPELPKIKVPTLVLAGASDSYTLPEWQREIAALIPNSWLVEIPEGGHLALISHAETFNEVVMEWLAGVYGKRSRSSQLPSAETA